MQQNSWEVTCAVLRNNNDGREKRSTCLYVVDAEFGCGGPLTRKLFRPISIKITEHLSSALRWSSGADICRSWSHNLADRHGGWPP